MALDQPQHVNSGTQSDTPTEAMAFSSGEAQWIWAPGVNGNKDAGQFVLFRKSFLLDRQPESPCPLHVSADTRYRLYVNGVSVSFGPCKSYPTRWYYESVDIAPFLQSGINVLAVRVLRLSLTNSAATSLMRTSKPGLILECNAGGMSISSNTSWKSRQDDSVQLVPNSEWDFRLGPPFISLWERADGRLVAQGWLDAKYDDAQWDNAVPSTMAARMSPVLDARKLVPRPIPTLSEAQCTFDGVVGCSGSSKSAWGNLLLSGKPVCVDSQSTVSVDVESRELTSGFLELCLGQDGEDGATVTIRASECYEGDMDHGLPRTKGDRADSANGKLYGPTDTYICRAGENRYEPFWWRAFRYVRLTFQTRSSPITINSIRYRSTHYPLAIETTLFSSSSSAADLESMWRISLNTLRNCMHETYEDCPYYEQNQFAMDSRLQMLFTYAISNDDRLARKTLHEFYASRREDGLIEAQFPAPCRMTAIPAFSLYWVLMVHDHMAHFGDASLVRRYFGTVDGILDHFAELVGPLGLVGHFSDPDETWAFVDWVAEWKTPEQGFKGMAVPRAYFRCGAATVHSLLYAIALQSAAELADCLGRKCVAEEYRSRAAGVNEAVRRHCFDTKTGLFTDGPGSDDLSQHTQVLAVLSGAATADQAPTLMRRAVLEREQYGVVRTSLAMAFYVFRAASLAGVYEELWDEMIRPWKVMMDQNLTTWAEFEVNPRSDCHGWSATPMYEIVREIAGVKVPGAKSNSPLVIEPRPKLVRAFQGRFIAGGEKTVEVSWEDGALRLAASDDLAVQLRLGRESKRFTLGKSLPLHESFEVLG